MRWDCRLLILSIALGVARPTGAATDESTCDPAAPVPSLGGDLLCSSVVNGVADHQTVEAREDVLVFSTPVLKEAIEVTGPMTVKPFAATSAKNTDWIVRLVDVYADGRDLNIQDGVLRAPYRTGKNSPAALLMPQKPYAFDIDVWATSNVLLPGHRSRREITNSDFPRFDRNLDTGGNPATGTVDGEGPPDDPLLPEVSVSRDPANHYPRNGFASLQSTNN